MSQVRQDFTIKSQEKGEWYIDEKIQPQCVRDLSDSVISTNSINEHGDVISPNDISGAFSSLLLLPDGRIASGASYDSTIKFWNSKTGTCEQTLRGHSSGVESLLLLPDGRIASCAGDQTIRLWNSQTGTCEQIISGHCGPVHSLLLLTDGRIASGGSYDSTIKLWNSETGDCEKTLQGESGAFYSLLQLPDGRIASGSWDSTIKLWNIKTGVCEKTLQGHTSRVNSLLLLPDDRIASCSDDETIKLWNSKTGTCELTLSGHGSRVRSLLLLPNRRIASSSDYGTIKVWNSETGACELTLSARSVYSLLLLSDGRIASGSYNSIELWDIGLRYRLLQGKTLSPVLLTQQITSNLNRLSVTSQPAIVSPSTSASELDEKNANILVQNETSLSHWHTSFEIPYNELKFGKELGRGGYGIVYLGTRLGEEVAIKKLLNQNPSDDVLAELKDESQIMAGLHSPSIVQMYGRCLEKPHYCIVMEYMPKGSLYNVLHSSENLSWETRYKIIRNIASGLVYLHTKNILHRDLKSLNVLLDAHYRAKLTDFGLAKLKTESQSTSTQTSAGTLAWMSPELFKRKAKCTKESDIYSLGITFWEVASRKVPFEDARGNQALIQNWIEKGERDDIPEDCPPKLAKLVKWCWEQDSTKRPTAEQVVDFITSEATEPDNHSAAQHSGPIYRLNSNS